MKTFKKNDKVTVNLGYKTVTGYITENPMGDKYASVKHDNFASEVFEQSKIELI